MTTLPATIPGLVRRCSPLLDPLQRKTVAEEVIDGWLRPQRLFIEQVHLDLTDPTGVFHACLYLAANLGMDGSKGVLWCRVERVEMGNGWHCPAHYVLRGSGWFWIFTGKTSDNPGSAKEDWAAYEDNPNGRTNIPGILGAQSDAEALRLAVLAVAGVQA